MSEKVNTISLETAQKWAKKWRKEEDHYNEHHEVHAFLIPLEDLTQLIDQGVDAVRAYIGVDENDDEKLMLVGTKYDQDTDTYYDMLPSGSSSQGEIYDFTRPCPPCCDKTSSLNNLP